MYEDLAYDAHPAALSRVLSEGWASVAAACDSAFTGPPHLPVPIRLIGEVLSPPEENVQSVLTLGLPDWSKFGWRSNPLLCPYMEQTRVLRALQRNACRHAQGRGLQVTPLQERKASFDVVLLPDTVCVFIGRSREVTECDWEVSYKPFEQGSTVLVEAFVSLQEPDSVVFRAAEVHHVNPALYKA